VPQPTLQEIRRSVIRVKVKSDANSPLQSLWLETNRSVEQDTECLSFVHELQPEPEDHHDESFRDPVLGRFLPGRGHGSPPCDLSTLAQTHHLSTPSRMKLTKSHFHVTFCLL